MGEYNPDRPYVMGMQWPPLVADAVQFDTGSEVGYTFRARDIYPPGGGLTRVRLAVAEPPPGAPSRKELLVNLYPAAAVAGTGPIRKLTIACTSGELLSGAALAGGAAQPSEAVQNPSDLRHVALTGANAAARFWFDTNSARTHAALDDRRILDVTVLYVMSGPFTDLAPAVTLGLERPSAGVNWQMDQTLTGPAVHNGTTVMGRSRLGELNPWWDTTASPTTQKGRVPWRARTVAGTVAGLTALSASGGTNINVRLQNSSSAEAGMVFQVHYLALEVTYGVENRVGAGGIDISGGATYATGYYYEIPMANAVTFNGGVELPRGREYALTVGQAYGGQLSVASPVPVRADRLASIEPFPTHRGVLLRKTLHEGSTPTVETVAEMPSIVALTAGGVPELACHPYVAQAVATVDDRLAPGDTTQQIRDDVQAEFVWARFYARHLPGATDPLEVFQVNPLNTNERLGPGGQITVEEFDALPDLASGWREVTVRLEPPLLSDGLAGTLWWAFSSSSGSDAPWQVLGADANPASQSPASLSDVAGYGGSALFATYDGQADEHADLTLALVQEMDAVTGLAVTPAVQELAPVDEHCGRSAGRIPDGIRYHRLSWSAINSPVVGGWGYYEVQRQDDTMAVDEWETIAKVVTPAVTAVDDYEARVGVESRYRIRMMHRIGIAGQWSEPVAATIAAPGVTGVNGATGLLILTSNHHPAGNLAYLLNWDRQAVEDFTFPEAEQVELQEMFGQDYRTAFRPLERGGVEFTRSVLVNAAAVPPATLDNGFRDLRDLAWDTTPYVCVRDELNNRWLSTLLVPSASVKRRKRGQLHIAQVTVVEVTATPAPLAGGPAPCEGLRAEGAAASVTASTPTPAAALAPRVFSDYFDDRTVPAGMGPGWTILNGAADDFSVAPESATIQLGRPLNANPTFDVSSSSWTAAGGTFARDVTQARRGPASGLLTPSGSAATVRAETFQALDIEPNGPQYRAAAWVYCAVSRTVQIGINWYDGSGAFLSTSTASAVSVGVSTWTRLEHAATAPAAAVRATLFVQMTGTPPAGHKLWIDDAVLSLLDSRRAVVGPGWEDVDVRARFRFSAVAVGQPLNAYVLARHVNSSNYYRARLAAGTTGRLAVSLQAVAGGVATDLTPLTDVRTPSGDYVTYAPGLWYWLRVQVRDGAVRAAVWPVGQQMWRWEVSASDTSVTGAGQVGVRAVLAAGNTNDDPTVEVSELLVDEPPGNNLDVRLELRPTGADWSVDLAHLSDGPGGQPSSGWRLTSGVVSTCFDLFGGGGITACEDTSVVVVRNQRRWIRAIYDNAWSGGEGAVAWYVSEDGATWVGVGSGTGPAEPPTVDPGRLALVLTGEVTVVRAEVRQGIDGPLMAAPDFGSQPAGTTSFTDSAGNLWEVDGRGICGLA
ncbi:hypothetical protein V6U90_15985 [Micromonospora sp. CPCC 206060]|uniref:hypothetical protein n=1 Tax=Micromonospora sp. CPCC 206060 TaxID=3122406 RepID=UPI002FEF754D